MIRKLRIVNFKRFRDTELSLAPLNVLTGANGAGKTSLIHSLLLIERCVTAGEGAAVALNDQRGLMLGEGLDVLHWNADPPMLVFEIEDEQGERLRWALDVPDDRSLHLPLREYSAGAKQFDVRDRMFTYLSADRLGPRDTLGASSVATKDLSVGSFGQYVAQVLAVLDRKAINIARQTTPPAGGKAVSGLLHQAEWWTHRIVRPVQIEAQWFLNSAVTQLRFKTPGIASEWSRPPNMGFGVSYALPIIVAGLIAPVGGLLLVENPEAHLHPAGQSEIGRFLARVAADGVQVVVETHSDHVLNGIRHAIANPEHPLAANQCQIKFFLSESDPRGVFRSLDISEAGGISGWPEGFFDQFDRDLRALAELQRKRRRKK